MTFFNIFSKKPEKKQNKVKIVVDNHEKNSLVASYLASLGFNIEFQNLPVADYLINEIAIERKTISDFKSSIINKRIMHQLIELKQYPKYFLILEGFENEDIYSGIIHENAFRGFLLSIALEYQIPIIFTKNEKDTAKYIEVLAKKSKEKSFSIRPKKIIRNKDERVQFILEGFPNIGPKTAKKLIDKFGSIKNIINAPAGELKEILGKRTQDFAKLIDEV